MGAIKLPHASGNSMSIAAPATNPSGDLTLTLPTDIGSAGRVLSVDGSGNLKFIYPPGYGYFRVRMNGDQVITDSTEEIIEFDVDSATDTFDSQNWFDTSTYKFTPQVAGVYHFNLQLFWNEVDNKAIRMRARIYKNTSIMADDYAGVDDVWYYHSHNTSALISLNGSSDYVKFQAYGQTSNGQNPGLTGGASTGLFSNGFVYLVEAT